MTYGDEKEKEKYLKRIALKRGNPEGTQFPGQDRHLEEPLA